MTSRVALLVVRDGIARVAVGTPPSATGGSAHDFVLLPPHPFQAEIPVGERLGPEADAPTATEVTVIKLESALEEQSTRTVVELRHRLRWLAGYYVRRLLRLVRDAVGVDPVEDVCWVVDATREAMRLLVRELRQQECRAAPFKPTQPPAPPEEAGAATSSLPGAGSGAGPPAAAAAAAPAAPPPGGSPPPSAPPTSRRRRGRSSSSRAVAASAHDVMEQKHKEEDDTSSIPTAAKVSAGAAGAGGKKGKKKGKKQQKRGSGFFSTFGFGASKRPAADEGEVSSSSLRARSSSRSRKQRREQEQRKKNAESTAEEAASAAAESEEEKEKQVSLATEGAMGKEHRSTDDDDDDDDDIRLPASAAAEEEESKRAPSPEATGADTGTLQIPTALNDSTMLAMFTRVPAPTLSRDGRRGPSGAGSGAGAGAAALHADLEQQLDAIRAQLKVTADLGVATSEALAAQREQMAPVQQKPSTKSVFGRALDFVAGAFGRGKSGGTEARTLASKKVSESETHDRAGSLSPPATMGRRAMSRRSSATSLKSSPDDDKRPTPAAGDATRAATSDAESAATAPDPELSERRRSLSPRSAPDTSNDARLAASLAAMWESETNAGATWGAGAPTYEQTGGGMTYDELLARRLAEGSDSDSTFGGGAGMEHSADDEDVGGSVGGRPVFEQSGGGRPVFEQSGGGRVDSSDDEDGSARRRPRLGHRTRGVGDDGSASSGDESSTADDSSRSSPTPSNASAASGSGAAHTYKPFEAVGAEAGESGVGDRLRADETGPTGYTDLVGPSLAGAGAGMGAGAGTTPAHYTDIGTDDTPIGSTAHYVPLKRDGEAAKEGDEADGYDEPHDFLPEKEAPAKGQSPYAPGRRLVEGRPERVGALVRGVDHASWRQSDPTDNVLFSAYAPEAVRRRQTFSLSVWAFLRQQAREVRARATAEGDTGRGHVSRALPVARGRYVTVMLTLPDKAFRVEGDARAMFVWDGSIHKVTRTVECLDGAAAGSHECTAELMCGAAVATLTFYLNVALGKPASGDEAVSPLQSKLDVMSVDAFERIPRSSLDISDTVLGHGSFGEARLAHLENGSAVVVKSLLEGDSAAKEAEFMHELGVQSRLARHPNVVTLLGACLDGEHPLLVLEHVARGNVEDMLQLDARKATSRKHVLPVALKAAMAADAACGLMQVHMAGLVHRDVAARNCLVADDYTTKVADFGMATLLPDSKLVEKAGIIALKYMAPESLKEPHVFSPKTDVFGFGVMLWEMYNEQPPFAHMSSRDAAMHVMRGRRLPRTDRMPEPVADIIDSCFTFDPAVRPQLSAVYEELRRHAASYGAATHWDKTRLSGTLL